jgi:hypothetical protein
MKGWPVYGFKTSNAKRRHSGYLRKAKFIHSIFMMRTNATGLEMPRLTPLPYDQYL